MKTKGKKLSIIVGFSVTPYYAHTYHQSNNRGYFRGIFNGFNVILRAVSYVRLRVRLVVPQSEFAAQVQRVNGLFIRIFSGAYDLCLDCLENRRLLATGVIFVGLFGRAVGWLTRLSTRFHRRFNRDNPRLTLVQHNRLSDFTALG